MLLKNKDSTKFHQIRTNFGLNLVKSLLKNQMSRMVSSPIGN